MSSEPSPGRDPDRARILGVVFGFSVALGVGTVTIPLVALAAGYDAAVVGLLAAVAAGTQLATRFALPWLLGRFVDRWLIAASALLLALAFGTLLVSTALPVFAFAQLLQGIARAIFWTSSQAHVVRDERVAVRRIVDVNLAGNAGTLVGPTLAGTLALAGLPVALGAGVVGGGIAALVALGLRRLAPFDRRRSAGTRGLLRREGMDLALWGSVAGGTWWTMLGSYIPVVLVGAGVGTQGVGWLVTASEAAGSVAIFALRRAPATLLAPAQRLAAFGVAGSLAAVALVPPLFLAYAVAIVVGGAASGASTTLSPALASRISRPDEQGDALALSGTLRAVALLGAPGAVAALLSVLTLSAALVAVAVVVAAPGAVVGRRGGAQTPGSVRDPA